MARLDRSHGVASIGCARIAADEETVRCIWSDSHTRIGASEGGEMTVPDRSSVYWKVLYAAVGLGAVASLALLRFADAPVLPWAVGIIGVGLACLAVIRWEHRHLAGRGTPQQTGAPGYWTTRRRIAGSPD